MIDDSYITRGLLYLLGWFIFGMPAMAVLGALIQGAGGAAVGLFLAIPIGLWGYHIYLTRQGNRAADDYARRLLLRRQLLETRTARDCTINIQQRELSKEEYEAAIEKAIRTHQIYGR